MESRLVLIVEDDTDIRETLLDVLAERGFRTVGAVNGAEALALLRSSAELPGMIVLDLMMPVMDGRAFREAQLQDPRLAAIPVVLASAHRDASQDLAQLQVQAWLRKPFKLPTLVETIERHYLKAG